MDPGLRSPRATLINEHRTTLVFVNTRRAAERAARHLTERLGEANVAAHHGSLAKELRLDAEHRLKRGELKVLVATASLELGIDIGDVDLVCQLGSPRSINAFLQRVGRVRSRGRRHAQGAAVPAVARRAGGMRGAARLPCGAVSSIAWRFRENQLDVLAQQIAAEVGRAANGTRTSCSNCSAALIRIAISSARNSMRSCRCWPKASVHGADGTAR